MEIDVKIKTTKDIIIYKEKVDEFVIYKNYLNIGSQYM
jgi:hypothetical protein